MSTRTCEFKSHRRNLELLIAAVIRGGRCYMCRYSGGLFLPKMVCFQCRRSFKEIARCPGCGQWLVSLGRDFKPPRRSDIKAWKVVERLYQNSVIFDSCGCSGPGWRPTQHRDVDSFLKSRTIMTEFQRLLIGDVGGRKKLHKKLRPQYKMVWRR